MHQIAFYVGSVAIHWYGVLIAVGFLLGLWTASRRSVHDGLRGEVVADLGPWLILAALVGSRLLFVITYWREFAGKPLWQIFNTRAGGLVFHGGLIAAALTTVFYARWKRLPVWKLADALAPSIALGHAFGRLGCFTHGCCYGRPTGLPWAVHFPADHVTYPAGVHPTQLYEAAVNLLLYAFLAWQYRRKQFPGQTFAVYLSVYSVLRFGLEFLRGDYQTYYFGWMTVGQVTSLVLLGLGIWLYRKRARAWAGKVDAAAQEAPLPNRKRK